MTDFYIIIVLNVLTDFEDINKPHCQQTAACKQLKKTQLIIADHEAINAVYAEYNGLKCNSARALKVSLFDFFECIIIAIHEHFH